MSPSFGTSTLEAAATSSSTMSMSSRPWIFKVSPSISMVQVSAALGFSVGLGSVTADLDAYHWATEFLMWADVADALAKLPGLQSSPMQSPNGTCGFFSLKNRGSIRSAGDVTTVDVAEDCKQTAMDALGSCTAGLVIMVHSVPGRQEMQEHRLDRQHATAVQRLRCIAHLAVAINEHKSAWMKMPHMHGHDRLFLVLVG